MITVDTPLSYTTKQLKIACLASVINYIHLVHVSSISLREIQASIEFDLWQARSGNSQWGGFCANVGVVRPKVGMATNFVCTLHWNP